MNNFMVSFYDLFMGAGMGNKCRIHIWKSEFVYTIHKIPVCLLLFSLTIFRSTLKVFSNIKIFYYSIKIVKTQGIYVNMPKSPIKVSNNSGMLRSFLGSPREWRLFNCEKPFTESHNVLSFPGQSQECSF